MKLTRLLERLEYEVRQGSDGIEVTELINDSRKVTEGSVFVCISKRSGCRNRGASGGGAGRNDSDPCR